MEQSKTTALKIPIKQILSALHSKTRKIAKRINQSTFIDQKMTPFVQYEPGVPPQRESGHMKAQQKIHQ